MSTPASPYGRCWNCMRTPDDCICYRRPDKIRAVVIMHPHLQEMREKALAGGYRDDRSCLERNRAEFARWCVEHGVLSEE